MEMRAGEEAPWMGPDEVKVTERTRSHESGFINPWTGRNWEADGGPLSIRDLLRLFKAVPRRRPAPQKKDEAIDHVAFVDIGDDTLSLQIPAFIGWGHDTQSRRGNKWVLLLQLYLHRRIH